MRILTAFTNSLGGRDSYHLGVSLAEAFSCPLDLVTVVKGGEGRYLLDVTDHAFQDVVATQVDDWMTEIIEKHDPLSICNGVILNSHFIISLVYFNVSFKSYPRASFLYISYLSFASSSAL